MANDLTFESVNDQINAADLAKLESQLPKGVEADAATTLSSVCSIYKVVRPILMLVKNLPLIPAKWKKVIDMFISSMDVICP